MELYHVDGKSVFEMRADGVMTGVISYLVHHDWPNGRHFSYGFDPNKETLEEAMGAFQKSLTDGTATRFNTDGGRLDGKDARIYWCNAHQRRATGIDTRGKPCCDPKLGGILLPCDVVDLTHEAEVTG